MREKKKILIISTMSSCPWGGSERLWVETAHAALRVGHEVFLGIYKWDVLPAQIQELKELGAIIHFIERSYRPEASIGKKAWIAAKKIIRLTSEWAFIKQVNPDLICVSQGGAYDIAYQPDLLGILKGNQIPLFLLCQFNQETFPFAVPQFWQTAQELYMRANRIFFVSPRNRETAERVLAMDLSRKSEIVNNSVNIKNPSILPWPQNPILQWAMVARLECQIKCQDVLLAVLASAKWKTRNWQLNLYGTGGDHVYLESLIKYYNLNDKVFLKGFEKEVKNIWKENHLMVLPSLAEGFPLSLKEAMLCGRPVLATQVGGAEEIVDHKKNGYLALGASKEALDNTLEDAWTDRSSWQEKGIQAFQSATKNFDEDAGATFLSKLLNSLK